jgi:hypothetical protein
MNDEQLFRQCLKSAGRIVKSYREQAPCDPQAVVATTTIIVAAIVVAAAAAAAYSAYSSAEAQQRSADFNKAVAKNNAVTASQQAAFAADRVRDRNRRVLAEQRTAILKSGGDLTGSGADLAMDSSIQGELDALSALYQGRISSGSQQSQARLFGMQSSYAGKAKYTGTAAAGLGSLAGGASTIASQPEFRQ